MMMKDTADLRKLIGYSKGGILSKELVREEKNNVSLFCMAAGTEMSEHTSSKEGVVYVIEGNGVFTLKGNKIKMLPGVLIYMRKKDAHSLKAIDDTSFLLALHD